MGVRERVAERSTSLRMRTGRSHRGIPANGGTARALAALVLIALTAFGAAAAPLDLHDSTPREVRVRFEVSPREVPGSLDAQYGPALPARLTPLPGGRLEVAVRGADIERVLLAEHGAKPGTFSDYVWVFDARTGEVVSAGVSGRLVRRLDMGPVHLDAEVDLEVAVATSGAAGYEPVRTLMGEPVFVHCDDPAAADCSLVTPRRLDPCTGYVNAVGSLEVGWGELRFAFFAPVGEAIFEEAPGYARVARRGAVCPLRAPADADGDIFGAWTPPPTTSPASSRSASVHEAPTIAIRRASVSG